MSQSQPSAESAACPNCNQKIDHPQATETPAAASADPHQGQIPAELVQQATQIVIGEAMKVITPLLEKVQTALQQVEAGVVKQNPSSPPPAQEPTLQGIRKRQLATLDDIRKRGKEIDELVQKRVTQFEKRISQL